LNKEEMIRKRKGLCGMITTQGILEGLSIVMSLQGLEQDDIIILVLREKNRRRFKKVQELELRHEHMAAKSKQINTID
jgi:hypothetical protein